MRGSNELANALIVGVGMFCWNGFLIIGWAFASLAPSLCPSFMRLCRKRTFDLKLSSLQNYEPIHFSSLQIAQSVVFWNTTTKWTRNYGIYSQIFDRINYWIYQWNFHGKGSNYTLHFFSLQKAIQMYFLFKHPFCCLFLSKKGSCHLFEAILAISTKIFKRSVNFIEMSFCTLVMCFFFISTSKDLPILSSFKKQFFSHIGLLLSLFSLLLICVLIFFF